MLHFVHYKLCRPHMSLGKRKTPAMAAGLADHVWSHDAPVNLPYAKERAIIGAEAANQGPYNPRSTL